MAEHLTKEEWIRRVRESLKRRRDTSSGATRLGDPDGLRAALERRKQRREAELP